MTFFILGILASAAFFYACLPVMMNDIMRATTLLRVGVFLAPLIGAARLKASIFALGYLALPLCIGVLTAMDTPSSLSPFSGLVGFGALIVAALIDATRRTKIVFAATGCVALLLFALPLVVRHGHRSNAVSHFESPF